VARGVARAAMTDMRGDALAETLTPPDDRGAHTGTRSAIGPAALTFSRTVGSLT
jgi:hypothetical protein